MKLRKGNAMVPIVFRRIALATLLVCSGGAGPAAFAQDRSAQDEPDNSEAETVETPMQQPELVLRLDDIVPQPGQRQSTYDTDGETVSLRRIENRLDLRLETRLDTRLDRRASLPRTEPDREVNSGKLSRSTSGDNPERR